MQRKWTSSLQAAILPLSQLGLCSELQNRFFKVRGYTTSKMHKQFQCSEARERARMVCICTVEVRCYDVLRSMASLLA